MKDMGKTVIKRDAAEEKVSMTLALIPAFSPRRRRIVSSLNRKPSAGLDEADTFPFPKWYQVQEVIVGQLLDDAPDAQPKWNQ